MGKHYVYSTLTATTEYAEYSASGGGGLNRPERSVVIQGGSNVATKNLVTPLGVVTPVTSEELDFLRKHPLFRQHLENGFLRISEAAVDPEVAAADMQSRDLSAPLTPNDYPNEEEAIKVTTATGKNKNRR